MIVCGDKLYVITRDDLLPGVQIAQSVHACRQFQNDWPDIENEWFVNSNYIVILSVKDASILTNVVNDLIELKIKHSVFYEPDLNNEITGVALEPSVKSKHFCSKFSLALSKYG